MQIITEEQLDFEDVLILPCSSEISSRKDVDVTREYKFRWCPYIIKGTGIMNANMGTIGNFNIAKHMMKFGLFSCLHKHHDIKDLIDFYKHWSDADGGFDYRLTFLSIGLKDNGLEKVRMIKKETGFLPSICVDVPNGYIPEVEELVRSIRSEFPDCLMMVGNVVTGDATRVLINAGADIVKIGIGGGAQCLLYGTKVHTKDGIKEIQDIREGDEVLTHTNEYHKVLSTMNYDFHHEKYNVNGVECTPEHKFLVINKSDKEKVTEDNLMEYAYWEEAHTLNSDNQLMVKII